MGWNFLFCNRHKDSGGPLIGEDPENDRHVQIGVVYGSLEECTDRNFPSLFARLDDYKILSFVRSTAFGENIAPVAKGTYNSSYLLKIYLDNLFLIICINLYHVSNLA